MALTTEELDATAEPKKVEGARRGTYTGYKIFRRDGDDYPWKEERFPEGLHGVPGDRIEWGTNYILNLLSFEQAMALAWWLKAQAVHNNNFGLQIKIQPYEVKYSCECYLLEKAGWIVDRNKEDRA